MLSSTKMITHNVVCFQCSNVTEIDKNSNSFQVVLKSYKLAEHSFNDQFGNNWLSGKPKLTSLPNQVDFVNSSFCDRECFIEYLKQHMTDDGMLQMTKDEIEQYEDQQPKEVKDLKRVSKALRELEIASDSYNKGLEKNETP